ncbi:hypothetical protein C8T65DRAFT_699844 [Cerioporus squamosus]|nr:hypothetical protein C8T65DRAFT_699844 [Cerioporus squamosus]
MVFQLWRFSHSLTELLVEGGFKTHFPGDDYAPFHRLLPRGDEELSDSESDSKPAESDTKSVSMPDIAEESSGYSSRYSSDTQVGDDHILDCGLVQKLLTISGGKFEAMEGSPRASDLEGGDAAGEAEGERDAVELAADTVREDSDCNNNEAQVYDEEEEEESAALCNLDDV